MDFVTALHKGVLLFDGAMGTQLIARGLLPGRAPEAWNLTCPDDVAQVHMAYLNAGCDVVTTNTFGANPLRHENAAALVAAGVSLARRAVNQCGRKAFVALDIGPTGRLIAPVGDLPFEDAVRCFSRMVEAGRDGADLVLIETMSDLAEVKAAVIAAKEHCGLPIVVTLSFDARGRLLTGGDIPAAVAMLEGLGVAALGFNCGLGPDGMKALLPQLAACASAPILVNPNAGLPLSIGERAVYDLSPDDFGRALRHFVQGGARAVGGCCGTTPDHMRAARAHLEGAAPLPLTQKRRTVVSSYASAVVLGGTPLLVGERLNPTGRADLAGALRADDMDVWADEARDQVDEGAHLLDVNAGLGDADEPDALSRAVAAVQGAVRAPLAIDTANPDAMERALRLYVGKPLLNAVNAGGASLERMLPLANKYGAAVVALPMDEGGVPESARARIALAQRIVDAAAQCGIAREDIVVDGLALCAATGASAAVTLETLRLARNKLGVQTILGVSNASFGLAQRPRLNAALLGMALSHGLSAAIVNPAQVEVMDAYHAALTLLHHDPDCIQYLARFGRRA